MLEERNENYEKASHKMSQWILNEEEKKSNAASQITRALEHISSNKNQFNSAAISSSKERAETNLAH